MRGHPRHRGFTLVSMMVGLLIGVICIAAMLVLYRMLVTTSYDVRQRAGIDAQLATSSLVAQQQLQQAGFGINQAVAGTDVIVLQHVSVTAAGKMSGEPASAYSSAVTGNAILWGYNPTGAAGTLDPAAYTCEGLFVDGNDLLRLSPVACTAPTEWHELTWRRTALVDPGVVGDASTFRLEPARCWPFGQTDAVNSLLVSYYLSKEGADAAGLPAPTSTAASAPFNAIPVFSVCLPNFRT